MGTQGELDGKENLAIVQLMETEIIRIAKRKHFSGVFSTNTSPLTQVTNIETFFFL